MRYSDIRDSDICVYEHDHTCRDRRGLLAAMKAAYPDFDEREMVTLVYYDADEEVKKVLTEKSAYVNMMEYYEFDPRN